MTLCIYSALVGALNSYIDIEKSEELFYESIKHLVTTPIGYSGIYNSLTFSLDKYFETNPDIIKCLLKNWIDFHLPEAKGMQVLEHLLNNFNDKNPKYFHKLISECGYFGSNCARHFGQTAPVISVQFAPLPIIRK